MKDKATGEGGRRRYSEEERGAILADADSLGVAETSRKHGVPQSTISNWRNRPMAAKRGTAPEERAPEASPPEPAATKRVAKRYTPSQKAEIVEYAAKHSVLEASRHFGARRFAIYEWQKRVAKAARGEGPSPTSGPSQSEFEEQRDRELLGEWHKHRGLGPSQIKNQLARRSIKVSVSTVRHVMQDAGYRPPKVKRTPHDERYEWVRPNHRWPLDFVHRYIHRANTFTLILIDDHSRFVVGHGVDDRERGAMVIRTFEEAVARHGKPERVMSDGGRAFWSWRGIRKFTTLLTEMEIEHEKAEHKEHNGKVEVFNANLHKELFDVHRFWDVTEMTRRLATHLHWYNHARTHHALGGLLVPADRYYGRAAEVLARIESGALRDGDELSLGERCLDLFKVVSRGGVPEVWLLGQRLLAPTTRSRSIAARCREGFADSSRHETRRTEMDVRASEPAVAPVVAAGLLWVARTRGVDLGLAMPRAVEIVSATGAGRSRAYEVRDAIEALLPSLARPPGRPLKAPEPAAPDATHALRGEVLRFVLDHPGCVHGGAQRRCYSGTFRCFVLELVERHPELPLAALSEAIAVPLGTLDAWLRPGPEEPVEPDAEPPVADATVPKFETLLDAWRGWSGSGSAPFGEHVRRDLHLDFGDPMIRALLFDYGERNPKRRPGRSPDEEALRGAFETYFAGAQWVGDGTEVEVLIDGEVFRLNLELMVDAHSGAWVGVEVSGAEDSAGVIAAFEAGVDTTGAPPLAVLLDNHPCNHTEEVDAALGDTLRIRATPFRPQNKAHVEGAFGLFAQRAPDIVLDTDEPRRLAHQIAHLVAVVFACALNHRPRPDRDGKSRVELYGEPLTEEQRREARERLRARLQKQERARQTRAARLDPVVRAHLDRAFERLDLDDPERHFRDAIARYPLDAIIDAIATFEGKKKYGSLPDGVDARYLLGIVRNLDARHEAEAITRALLDARLAARDALLEPLVRRQRELARFGLTEHIRHLIDEAMAAARVIERHFWLGVLANLIRKQPEDPRRDRFRAAARRIHSSFRGHRHDRDAAERILARLTWPLA